MQDKLTAIAENSVALRDMCVKHHYVATLTGNGTNTLSFQVPFTADALTVLCIDPMAQTGGYNLIMLQADRAALSLAGCMALMSRNGAMTTNTTNAAGVEARCSQAQDGTVTVSTGATNCYFAQGRSYLVMATTYTDKSLKERYIQLIEGLTGSGTLAVCADRIYSVFTTEEWAALTATKPDWTFKEV